MKCLITGIGGFIGSHCLAHLLVHTDWDIVGIDSWNHKGISERITSCNHYQQNKHRVKIYTHDLNAGISDVLISNIGHVDYIINFASQSHVDRSIDDPVPFVKNNVNIALNMLEYARVVKPKKFIQIGTDESYGPTDKDGKHKEWSAILPSNPYSASKACQEAIAISYWRTYGVPVILTNTMNNFAEMQDQEKFIPKVIRSVITGDKLYIHSDAECKESGSRYWLHARNHAAALLYILNNIEADMYPSTDKPQRFNIVGEKRVSNVDIALKVADIMGKSLNYELVDAHSSRPGHDLHYGLDGSKLSEYGWRCPVNLSESLRKTVKWTLDHPEWLGIEDEVTV